jgi:hypothetical protein
MKILYITAFFPPNNVIASVRSDKLLKYMSKNESVAVLTYKTDEDYKSYDKNYKLDYKLDINYFGRIANRIFKLMNVNKIQDKKILNYSFMKIIRRIISGIQMFFCVLTSTYTAIKVIKKMKPDNIIVTFGPHFIVWIGIITKLFLKKERLILDVRDPIVTSNQRNANSYFDKYLQKAYIKFCDALVAVTPWIMNLSLGEYKDQKKHKVITNGFDTDDKKYIENIWKFSKKDSKLHILVMGTFYKNSNPKALFIALIELISDKLMDLEDVVIHYAGADIKKFKEKVEDTWYKGEIVDHGYLDRKSTLILEKQCNVVVLLTWNYFDEQDMYTGKLFEYLLVKSSVLGIIEGNMPNSKVKSIIENSGIGICYEYCNDNLEIIKDFLVREVYTARSRGEIIRMENQLYIEKFSYLNLGKQYIDFINEV